MSWWEKLNYWTQRKFWRQSKAIDSLRSARWYVYHQYWEKPSSESRGFALPETREALDILDRLSHECGERLLELL
jgi:hypothetical protein